MSCQEKIIEEQDNLSISTQVIRDSKITLFLITKQVVGLLELIKIEVEVNRELRKLKLAIEQDSNKHCRYSLRNGLIYLLPT